MVADDFLCGRVDGVLTVTLNRPDRLNALNWSLRLGLEALWSEVRRDASVRCVVVTGSGRGFCSGADAEDLAGPRFARGEDLNAELSFLPGRQLDVPVVVAVNGVCAGGGLHFVADGDITIAGQSATFLDPHVSVGQVSGIEPASLAMRVPLQVLARLALLGRNERLDADAAVRLGLVTEVVADDRLLDRAAEIAASIAAASPAAVRATRRVLRDLEVSLLEPAMAAGWEAVQAHWTHPDAVEGPVAFAERREPQWAAPAAAPPAPAAERPTAAPAPEAASQEGSDGPDRR
jgi:enoyl-CoA hydratase/carnithine racemase